MMLNGSEIVLECLIEQGVDSVFGYPGGAILYIYDALYKYQDKIKHYLTSHEQGASHAADGYARSTGKVGVCLATSGPGATNLVTGIATAYMDSIPMVAITANVALPLLGKDSFQEVDIAGITMPITKHNFIVKDVNDLANVLRRAFYIAKEGRPGPVLVDITKDVTAAMCEFENKPVKEIKRKTSYIRENDVEKVMNYINECKRPFIYAGGGIIRSMANDELLEFAKKIDSPVCTSTMGLGGFPTSHELYTGMIGMHGTKTSSLATTECDLLIAIGARFSDRVVGKVANFAPNAKIVHIDIDPAEVNKNKVVDASIIGDCKSVLDILNSRLAQQKHTEWINTIKGYKKQYPLTYKKDEGLKQQYILERISELTKNKAIIVTEVGQHQMWACQYMELNEPQRMITSLGLGTMGFGLGAAIGAKVGNPDQIVFNISGDGCFRMNNIELTTAVEYNIPVIVCVMNNHTLGMVRQWQTLFYDKRFSHTDLEATSRFVKIAEAHGALAFNVTKPEEVDDVLKKAIASNRPVVINFEVPTDDMVFPMVPAGAGIDEIILE